MGASQVKKIVLIAGEPSHGPGEHEYDKTVRLLKVLLDQSIYREQLQVHIIYGGWPDNDELLEDADLLLFTTDGRDGELFQDVPFVVTDSRMELMTRCMARGCGLILLHFSTFFTREEGRSVLEWAGGYFEWEDEFGERNWYSRIGQGQTLRLASREHPICRGVTEEMSLQDEVYYQLRMVPGDPRRTPIWTVPELAGDQEETNLVGWALERADGGRSFVTTAGHSYSLWKDDHFRKVHLQAVLWAAGFDIPEGGVHSRYYTEELVDGILSRAVGDNWTAAAVRAVQSADDAGSAVRSDTGAGHAVRCDTGAEGVILGVTDVECPIQALVLSGNDQHKWHNWEETTPRILDALHEDPGITAVLTLDPEVLRQWDLSPFDTIVLNYCNWQDPSGLSESAKAALIEHMERGGGLVVLHFANGAFHFSLPDAGESDWPEYRKMVPRVWNHHEQSGHDDYGPFTVHVTDKAHPLTSGIANFGVRDELYYRQEGDSEVHVLLEADSVNTGQREPIAWTSVYRNGRVFQTLLGHDGAAYDVYEVREMLRRAVLWTAGKLS